MKLLLVEDNKELANSVLAYPRGEGYQSELATNLKEALDKIAMYSYDCILLDITLPDGNGLMRKKMKR